MTPPRPNLDLTEPKPLKPGLHIVSTPIGNLRDITLRALDTLAAADRVFAEDTRTTAKLLAAFGLKNRLEAYHDHNGEAARPRVLAALADGERVALVSEAGTPLISDPGFKLVREAAAAGFEVLAVPGPSAVLAALAVAGLPTDRFLFAGFLSPKPAARRRALEELAAVRATLVLFESGPRLPALLHDMAEVLGPRDGVVARELTKLFETCVRGTLPTLSADAQFEAVKGEIVVLAAPGEELGEAVDADAALREALSRLSPGEAAGEVARALNLPRRDLYRRALALKDAP